MQLLFDTISNTFFEALKGTNALLTEKNIVLLWYQALKGIGLYATNSYDVYDPRIPNKNCDEEYAVMAAVILHTHSSRNNQCHNLHYYEQFVNLSLRTKHCALRGSTSNDDSYNW